MMTDSDFPATPVTSQESAISKESPAPEDSSTKEAAEKIVEAADIARETAEQSALPYTWRQTLLDVDITLSIPAGLRGRDLNVSIGKNALTVGVKGKDPIMTGALCKSIK